MRRIAALLLAVALVLALGGCSRGDVNGVARNIYTEGEFTHADINGAMDAVEKHFRKHFGGCTLLLIEYDDGFSTERAEGLAEKYGADRCVVLTSSFETDAEGGKDHTFNPNDTYTRFQWIVTETNGRWKVQDCGY